MNKKRIINWLQNLTLAALAVSTVFLLTRFPVMEGALSGQMQALLAMPDNTVRSSLDVSLAISAVHIAVTDEIEYGRYAGTNVPVDGETFQRMVPLLREAIGSALAGEKTTDAAFRAALETPGIYLDLTTELPLACVAAWLGEDYADDGAVRALALTTEQETATLFWRCADGTIIRSKSALTSVAVRELTAAFAPNGGRFAYESGYDALAPYTVLVQEAEAVADVRAAVPDGYSAYNLLTALDFNAHTYSRYVESSGVEVVFQSPRTLRISTDGSVSYSSAGEVSSELYQIAGAGDIPTSVQALQGACAIAAALTEGTGAATLAVDSVERTENGWIVSFAYCVEGIKVRLGNDRTALRVVVSGDAVTEFEYYCRAYTGMEQSSVLLPPSMAVAIAALHDGAELTMAYVDSGADVIGANWFAE